MNTFANIEVAIRFKKVTYYTVRIDGDEDNLFMQFIKTHGKEPYRESLVILRSWLTKIGNEIGAFEEYFRPEGFRDGDARALPPPFESVDLRWYCMRISTRIVVLFGGAEKTANTAQECDNVRPHFLLANKLTACIDEAISDGRISESEDGHQLMFSKDLKLEL